jgi:DNA-binding IclR family transcriptional regulator
MAGEGFVIAYPEERTWGLGVGVFEVGSAYLRHDPLERLARPLLATLAARVSDEISVTAHLGILDGAETLYLLKEQGTSAEQVVSDVGVRLPAHLTATGRAILGQLSQRQLQAIYNRRDSFSDRTGNGPKTLTELMQLLRSEQRRGYAKETGFITDGFGSLAVAVLDHSKRPVAALSVVFAIERLTPEIEIKIVQRLQKTSRELGRRLGARL